MKAGNAPVAVVLISYGWSGKRSALADAYPLLVVENDVRTRWSESDVQQAPLNWGFAKAANWGMSQTDAPYLLFLNEDCQFTAAQLELLYAELRQRQLQAISPQFLDTTGQPQLQYHQPLPTFGQLLRQWSPLRYVWPASQQRTTLPGGCLLISRQALQAVGSWDERFWLWWEDADLSLRLAQAGIAFGCSARVTVKHLGGATFRQFSASWQRDVFFHSLRLLAAKHFPGWQAAILNRLTRRFSAARLYPPDSGVRSSIVVPNLDRQLLADFLARHAASWDWTQDELIVVTAPATVELLRRQYPQVIWIALDQNQGFAPAVNLGWARARGEWLGTVNDDTELPTDWISHLVAAAQPTTAALNPVVKRPDGQVESAGIKYHWQGKAEPLMTVPPVSQATDLVNAAAVLFRRTALVQVGLLDPRFGSYLEDLDLSLRLRRHGWQLLVVPQVQVRHYGQQTSQHQPYRRAWQNVRNWWLLLFNNYSWQDWIRHLGPILIERGRNLSGWGKSLLTTPRG